MLPHYYNLRSDYLVGYIDRHNYFGEGLFDSLLAQPGSGYFSSGLQQVADRPFGLSEWITVYPSLYSADGPALIAAYGLGLQGWDASYEFQSQSAHRLFSDRAGWPPWGVWEADVPTQIGQFPALARMIYRGDVKEAPVISTRRVSPDALATGTFNFTDKVVQQGDIKSFGGSVPPEALAAGRVVVEFTDKEQPSTFPDLAPYRAGTALTSATKQLVWDTAGQGWFTVDTPGTKAVVGFAGGKTAKLGDITIAVASPYASIFLTALARTETLGHGQERPAHRRRPQLQYRLQILCARFQGPRQRQSAHPPGAGPSHHHHLRSEGSRREHPRPQRPPHRQDRPREKRSVHHQRSTRQDAVLRSRLPVAHGGREVRGSSVECRVLYPHGLKPVTR